MSKAEPLEPLEESFWRHTPMDAAAAGAFRTRDPLSEIPDAPPKCVPVADGEARLVPGPVESE